MRILLIVNLAISFSAAAQAQPARWQPIGSSDTGSYAEFDRQTLRYDGKIADVWVAFDYSRDKTQKARSAKSHQLVNCETRQLANISYITYGPSGEVQFDGKLGAGYEDVIPESVGEMVLEKVCGYLKVQP